MSNEHKGFTPGEEPRMTEVQWRENDELRVKFEGGPLHLIFEEAADMLLTADAPNYLAIKGFSRKHGELLEMVIQRAGAMTPAEKNIRLAAREVELEAEVERLRAALKRIACPDDYHGNQHLELTGSYGHFDEPMSVQIARKALAGGGE